MPPFVKKPGSSAIRADLASVEWTFENSERVIQSFNDRLKTRDKMSSFYDVYVSPYASNPLSDFHKICFFDYLSESNHFSSSWFVIEEVCEVSLISETNQHVIDSILYCLESLDIYISKFYFGE